MTCPSDNVTDRYWSERGVTRRSSIGNGTSARHGVLMRVRTEFCNAQQPTPAVFTTKSNAGDGNTTALHLASLLAFYERFPAFRNRPLFVTGHSYAGG